MNSDQLASSSMADVTELGFGWIITNLDDSTWQAELVNEDILLAFTEIGTTLNEAMTKCLASFYREM